MAKRDRSAADARGAGSPGAARRLWIRAAIAFGALVVVGGVASAALYMMRPTTLTVAVAPRDGTEPGLMTAFAEALAEGRKGIRLKILLFDDVRESAAALQDGKADLAVVRPDVSLPTNGLTVAVLRDQAMMIVSPGAKGISAFPELSGKRLGIAAHREADSSLLKTLLGYYALTLDAGPRTGPVPRNTVLLVPVDEDGIAAAFRSHAIDALVSIIAPSAPRSVAQVAAVASAARDRRVSFVAVEDDDAILERFPLLQAVTIQGGLFGGRPKVPDDDVKTVGASYRLLARDTLNRSVTADLTQDLFELRPKLARTTEAAAYVAAPSYDTTVAATSARLPNHPGAIDYYERDQHGFVDRYSDTLYLLALVASGVGSVLAWLRQRVLQLRHHRIDEIMERLLAIAGRAREGGAPADLDRLADEVEVLAAETVRCARDDDPSDKVMMAAAIAVETARNAVLRRRDEGSCRSRSGDSA